MLKVVFEEFCGKKGICIRHRDIEDVGYDPRHGIPDVCMRKFRDNYLLDLEQTHIRTLWRVKDFHCDLPKARLQSLRLLCHPFSEDGEKWKWRCLQIGDTVVDFQDGQVSRIEKVGEHGAVLLGQDADFNCHYVLSAIFAAVGHLINGDKTVQWALIFNKNCEKFTMTVDVIQCCQRASNLDVFFVEDAICPHDWALCLIRPFVSSEVPERNKPQLYCTNSTKLEFSHAFFAQNSFLKLDRYRLNYKCLPFLIRYLKQGTHLSIYMSREVSGIHDLEIQQSGPMIFDLSEEAEQISTPSVSKIPIKRLEPSSSAKNQSAENIEGYDRPKKDILEGLREQLLGIMKILEALPLQSDKKFLQGLKTQEKRDKWRQQVNEASCLQQICSRFAYLEMEVGWTPMRNSDRKDYARERKKAFPASTLYRQQRIGHPPPEEIARAMKWFEGQIMGEDELLQRLSKKEPLQRGGIHGAAPRGNVHFGGAADKKVLDQVEQEGALDAGHCRNSNDEDHGIGNVGSDDCEDGGDDDADAADGDGDDYGASHDAMGRGNVGDNDGCDLGGEKEVDTRRCKDIGSPETDDGEVLQSEEVIGQRFDMREMPGRQHLQGHRHGPDQPHDRRFDHQHSADCDGETDIRAPRSRVQPMEAAASTMLPGLRDARADFAAEICSDEGEVGNFDRDRSYSAAAVDGCPEVSVKRRRLSSNNNAPFKSGVRGRQAGTGEQAQSTMFCEKDAASLNSSDPMAQEEEDASNLVAIPSLLQMMQEKLSGFETSRTEISDGISAIVLPQQIESAGAIGKMEEEVTQRYKSMIQSRKEHKTLVKKGRELLSSGQQKLTLIDSELHSIDKRAQDYNQGNQHRKLQEVLLERKKKCEELRELKPLCDTLRKGLQDADSRGSPTDGREGSEKADIQSAELQKTAAAGEERFAGLEDLIKDCVKELSQASQNLRAALEAFEDAQASAIDSLESLIRQENQQEKQQIRLERVSVELKGSNAALLKIMPKCDSDQEDKAWSLCYRMAQIQEEITDQMREVSKELRPEAGRVLYKIRNMVEEAVKMETSV